ncbi:hypothetical protein LLS1_37860 [Leifsonia sp. LS1]|uniref:hypothetical protein n=1 Tax=Leifsonia sp. LS1 TaxID=2828483 RepID=UPI001CFD006D|nr:hypothetical protein [Leifsonia sp. LS1]GIT82117.1 hypothetical protein LLS1_37860 [Leifsonia sp. LS1]
MAASGKKVGVDGETVLDHAKRIDAATVADAAKLVQEYQVGGSSGGTAEPALSGFIAQLGDTLDTIAANATKLNKTVASNTDALRDAVKTLNEADDQAKSDAQTLQALIDDQPQPKGKVPPAPAPAAPAGPVAPTGSGTSSPGDVFQKSAGSDRH